MEAATDVVQGLGYLAIGVSNLEEAIGFYSRIARLDMTERNATTAFMTGGIEHHWVRLEEGNGQGVKRVGYELANDAAFGVVRAGLKDWGIEFTEGGDPDKDRVLRWLRFTDPGGTDIELFYGMYQRGVAPMNQGVKMEKFLHGGWETKNFATATRFYQEVLGFKPSDWLADKVGFFRAGDLYHHSLVVLNSNRSAFNHFCIQVESLDDVMRFRNNALRFGVPLRDDLLRHAPSGSIGVYMTDTSRQLAVEFCVGHPQIDDPLYRPRVLPLAPEIGDMWRTELPDNTPRGAGIQEIGTWAERPDIATEPQAVPAGR